MQRTHTVKDANPSPPAAPTMSTLARLRRLALLAALVAAGLPVASVPAAAEPGCDSMPPATPTFDGGAGGWPSEEVLSPWQPIRNDPNAYWGPMSAFMTTAFVHGVPGCWSDPGYAIAGYSWDVVPFGTTAPLEKEIRREACDGCAWSTHIRFEAPSAFGSYSLRVAAVSNHGVWSGEGVYSFGVDRVAPEVLFVDPAPGGEVDRNSPVRVRYSDRDVLDGQAQDPFQTATQVDPQSALLELDGTDVEEREKAECTQLGQDGPILGPAQDEAWLAVLGVYEEVLRFVNGERSLGPLRSVLSNDRTGLSGELWKAQQALGTPDGDDVPVYGDALGRVCGRTVAPSSEFTYTPLKPWSPGPHAARIAFTDDALGFRANAQSYTWAFSVR